MGYRHSNAVREIPVEDFESHTERYVLIELAHLSDNGGVLRYSQEELSQAIGLSRITVAREMKKLESKGLIAREKHGQYKVNIFLTKQAAVQRESEAEPQISEFDEWWDENALMDNEGNEAVVIPIDKIPEEVTRYKGEGLLKLRQGMTYQGSTLCDVYERV